jgi:hypothetical protein
MACDAAKMNEKTFCVSARTCEALAMMFLVPEDEAPAGGPTRTARVRFNGAFGGELRVTIAEAALAELAGNMLGFAEEAPTVQQQEDALKELANVVCGNLLPALAGPEPIFHIDAPELVDDLRSDEPTAWARLGVEPGLIEVALYADALAAVACPA